MRWIRGFVTFWWDFIIGDDWLVALAVIAGLGATYAIAHSSAAPIWWLLPVAVILVLPLSIVRLTRRSRRP
ncbi:hypothetical protein V3G39_08670 [Dermatophilaceae bacterium Sec6.4]|nr:hypothetical protein [Actinomycetota bacterium]